MDVENNLFRGTATLLLLISCFYCYVSCVYVFMLLITIVLLSLSVFILLDVCLSHIHTNYWLTNWFLLAASMLCGWQGRRIQFSHACVCLTSSQSSLTGALGSRRRQSNIDHVIHNGAHPSQHTWRSILVSLYTVFRKKHALLFSCITLRKETNLNESFR